MFQLAHSNPDGFETNSNANSNDNKATTVDMFTSGRNRILILRLPQGLENGPFRHLYARKQIIVLAGFARIRSGDQVIDLLEGQAHTICPGQSHVIENAGKIPLEFMEIRTGAYLGDDDQF